MSASKSSVLIKAALTVAVVAITGLGLAGTASARPPAPTIRVYSPSANAETIPDLKGRIDASMQEKCQRQYKLNLVTGNPRFNPTYHYSTYSGGYVGSGNGWCQ